MSLSRPSNVSSTVARIGIAAIVLVALALVFMAFLAAVDVGPFADGCKVIAQNQTTIVLNC